MSGPMNDDGLHDPGRVAAFGHGIVLDPETGLPPECRGAHKTGSIIWPGTAHQHVLCERCRRRLPV